MPHVTTRIFILSFATLAMLHILSLRFYLYWRHEWLDIPMHLFGGSVVALGIFAAAELRIPCFRALTKTVPALFTILTIALVWEIYEYGIGISVVNAEFIPDTALDLVMGMAGGVVGIYIARKLSRLNADTL